MNNIIIRRYAHKDRKDALSLLKLKWDSLTKEEYLKKFEWRYYKNPVCNLPFIYLAFSSEGEPIGLRGFVPHRFQLKGIDKTIYIHSDTIVHPNFRGRGVYSRINEYTVNNSDFDKDGLFLNLSSSPQSLKGYYKFGWSSIGLKQYFVRFSPMNYFLRVNSSRNKISSKIIKVKNGQSVLISYMPDFKAIPSFESGNKNTFGNKNTIEYLEWRYSEPNQKFVFLYLFDSKVLLSYAILKIINKGYLLMDFDFKEEKNIIDLLNISFQKLKIPLLRLFSFQNNYLDSSLLKNMGFITNKLLNDRFLNKNRTPVLVRNTCDEDGGQSQEKHLSGFWVNYSDVH